MNLTDQYLFVDYNVSTVSAETRGHVEQNFERLIGEKYKEEIRSAGPMIANRSSAVKSFTLHAQDDGELLSPDVIIEALETAFGERSLTVSLEDDYHFVIR